MTRSPPGSPIPTARLTRMEIAFERHVFAAARELGLQIDEVRRSMLNHLAEAVTIPEVSGDLPRGIGEQPAPQFSGFQ